MVQSILRHWRALSILLGSLVASILFAIGHHLYYHNLAGTPVSTANALAIGGWEGVSSQKLNTAVGTTFAALFRTSLSVAVTTAFAQLVWQALKAKGTKLNIVDALSGVLQYPLSFLNWEAWKGSMLLFGLAIAIWVLPIAPIITPATLTITTMSRISHDFMNVSAVDFNSLNFASIRSSSQGACGLHYTGPEFEVSKIAAATAAQGAVLPIAAPRNQPNASYTYTFSGPSLQCSDVANPLLSEILTNINATSYNISALGPKSYGYLSWAPRTDDPLPFDKTDPLELTSIGRTLGPRMDGPLNLYVATFPQLRSPDTTGGMLQGWEYYGNATIVNCQLANANYTASFNWTNGIRELDVALAPPTNDIFYRDEVDCNHFLYTQDVPGSFSRQTSLGPLSMYNNTVVQTYAYQSVMDAFAQILVGSIGFGSGYGLDISTTVMNTPIGSVHELEFLRANTSNSTMSLKGFFSTPNTSYWPGVSVPEKTNSSLRLRTALEQLFQNITLSLTSSDLLQPDPATPYYPPPANVTFITYHNIYSYSALTLWLAYGIAILLATITVTIGCAAIFTSGLSYSSSFSTVLRTTSHASVSETITRTDAIGQDPLPKHLAVATVTFEDGDQGKEMDVLQGSSDDDEGKGRLLQDRESGRYAT